MMNWVRIKKFSCLIFVFLFVFASGFLLGGKFIFRLINQASQKEKMHELENRIYIFSSALINLEKRDISRTTLILENELICSLANAAAYKKQGMSYDFDKRIIAQGKICFHEIDFQKLEKYDDLTDFVNHDEPNSNFDFLHDLISDFFDTVL